MVAKPSGPLSRDHLDKLNQVLQSAAETDRLISQLRNAGLPVDQAASENEQQRQLAAGLKAAFFPGEP